MSAITGRLTRVLTALCCDTWLLPPAVHKTLTDIVAAHAQGGESELAQHIKAAAMGERPQKRMFEVIDSTAIIPVQGIIGRKFSDMLYESGVTSTDILDRMIQTAAADPQIDSIMLMIDSPGGMAMGTPEVGMTIKRAEMKKPVMAFADGLMGSAAYWMASQSSVIYAMPSADVGSIGAYLAIMDQHRAAEMQGIKVKLFNGGATYKGMGYPGTELTKEQEAILEERVKTLSDDFKNAVRSGRVGKKIADEVMQGQSFNSSDALANGLVDAVTTWDQALRDLQVLGKLRKGEKVK
jgi:capsid assembly protease